ncbi:MFS transporter [Estrella lausannensis]|uniref:To nasA protein n=1 Tax=Estrella lausannensis TaxID=483423 RepID=A0A0H5DPK7_9BACT|nr:MFS transporter [Estrella lausannensis]CRX37933.1 to nasA protein [Estrella lausannensis]
MKFSASNSRTFAWGVWIIASVFYAYQYILRVMPNIMLNDIMEQFGIGAAAFGQFSGVYYIGYSLLHLPIGIMLDRYGPKKIMTLCILCTVVGLTPLLFAEHWMYPIAGRFLIGLGSSAAILGVFKIIRITFDERTFPRMLSLSVMIGLIGAIYGGGPISYMREHFGYQLVVQSLAIGGLLLAALTYFVVPDIKESSERPVTSDIKEVLTNGRVVWSCLFAGMMVGPLEGFADVWGTVFLKTVYGYEGTIAAGLPSMMFVGMCFGAPFLSWIAEKVGSYQVTIMGAGAAMAACFAALLMWQLPSWGVSFNFIVVGVCSAYQILAIYQASTYVREQVAGLTTAVANMIIMIFGYGFHTAIGGIVNAMGGPSVSNALIYGTVVVPITLAVGTAGFTLLYLFDKTGSSKAIKEPASTR